MEISRIPAAWAARFWPLIKDAVDKALARSYPRFAPDDILKSLENSQRQLWLVHKDGDFYAVCITEIVQYPQRRTCSVLLCTGRQRQNWQHLLGEIETWARHQECRSMELWARPGWARILKQYDKTHILLEREL